MVFSLLQYWWDDGILPITVLLVGRWYSPYYSAGGTMVFSLLQCWWDDGILPITVLLG